MSTNIFSITYLAIILISLFVRKQQYSLLSRLFINIIAATILVLMFEIGSWYFEGKPGAQAKNLNTALNFVFFLLNPFPAIAWLCYIDYKIHGSVQRLRKRLYYLPILLITSAMIIVNTTTPWIYGIGPDNLYYRGPGSAVYTAAVFLIIYASIPMVIKNRGLIDRNIFIAYYAFSIFPLAGAVVQLLVPGTLIGWNAVALAVLTIFIFLEIQNLSKDFLTGLYNRRQIDEWIHRRIRMTKKGRSGFALILIDLDEFKRINDSYGHQEGDQALIVFSNIISRAVKNKDIVSRFAGDEFLIALENEEIESAETVVDRMREKMAEFNAKGIKPYAITFSAGCVVFDPAVHEGYKDLLRSVDQEMYLNKNRNKAAGKLQN